MFETYEEPTRAESDDYTPRDNYGNTAIVRVLELRNGVDTVNGPADAVYVDVYDVTLAKLARNVMLMGGAFVDGLKPYIGKGPVVVFWQKRESKAGRPYAVPAAATPEMIKAAEAVYAKGDPFLTTIADDDAEVPF